MVSAYKLTWEAESLCATMFKKSKVNDASDACRHFVWAAFLYKYFGLDISVKVLNAHEKKYKQPKAERAMDIANNHLGIIVSKQLLNSKKWSKEAILKSFKLNLRESNIIVLEKNIQNMKKISGDKK